MQEALKDYLSASVDWRFQIVPTISMFYGIVARMYFVPEDGEGLTCNAPDSLRSQVIAALSQQQAVLKKRIYALEWMKPVDVTPSLMSYCHTCRMSALRLCC